MIAEAIFAHLSAGSITGPLLSNGAIYRIFPSVIPQKEPEGYAQLPCVVYELRGEDRQVAYCGTSKLIRATMSVDSLAATMLGAIALGDAVREWMVDYSGMMGATEVRTVSLESVDTRPDMEPGIYRVEQTYTIWYVED